MPGCGESLHAATKGRAIEEGDGFALDADQASVGEFFERTVDPLAGSVGKLRLVILRQVQGMWYLRIGFNASKLQDHAGNAPWHAEKR